MKNASASIFTSKSFNVKQQICLMYIGANIKILWLFKVSLINMVIQESCLKNNSKK